MEKLDRSRLTISPIEVSNLIVISALVVYVHGDVAEVGVFKGGSAKIISENIRGKKLHLFETFEGLPKISEKDKKGQFEVDY